jgi:hypothetical protein
MLPLGRRVQDKLEALIDKHMSTLGASKLALSSISSEELWTRSGRLNSASEVTCSLHGPLVADFDILLLALSTQRQKRSRVSSCAHTRRRNHILSFKHSEVIQRAPSAVISNLYVAKLSPPFLKLTVFSAQIS